MFREWFKCPSRPRHSSCSELLASHRGGPGLVKCDLWWTDIVLLEGGRIRQQGSPESIYSAPRNLFSAQFIGSPPMNIIKAENLGDGAGCLPPGAVSLGFRPEKAVVSDGARASGKALVSLRGELAAREILGDHAIYKFKTAWGDIHTKTMSGPTVDYGAWRVEVDAKHLYCFDEKGDVIK